MERRTVKIARGTIATGPAEGPHRVLSQKEVTEAVHRFARRYGYFIKTVRDLSDLKAAALQEYRSVYPKPRKPGERRCWG